MLLVEAGQSGLCFYDERGAPDFDTSPVSISASPVRRQNEYGERRRHDHRRFEP
jgi:hypothetical protein